MDGIKILLKQQSQGLFYSTVYTVYMYISHHSLPSLGPSPAMQQGNQALCLLLFLQGTEVSSSAGVKTGVYRQKKELPRDHGNSKNIKQ